MTTPYYQDDAVTLYHGRAEDFYATEAAKIRADVDSWGGEVL